MSELRLRPVKKTDAKQLFEWTNEAETRKNSFSSEPVLWENHVAWLKGKLADKNCLFFIMTEDEKPVGTIRLDVDAGKKNGVISYGIAKQSRGKGFGRKILGMAEEQGKKNGLLSLTGSVKPQNKASCACFIHNGYKLAEKTSKELVYKKLL